MHIARDVYIVGRCPQSQNLSVVPNGDIHFVGARQEEQGVARGAELAILLDAVNLVDLLLDRLRRHGRVEDEHVGPKIRFGSRHNPAGGIRDHRQKQAEFHHRSRTSELTRMIAAQYLLHFAALPADWDPWVLFSVLRDAIRRSCSAEQQWREIAQALAPLDPGMPPL